MLTNKFTGKVFVVGANEHDLPGSLIINFPFDIDSSVVVRAAEDIDLLSSVFIAYSDYSDLPSFVQPAIPYDIPSSVFVRPHNKMSGFVEVVEPPTITVRLSPVEDTYARDDMPKLNYGHDHDMFVGVNSNGTKYRSFLRFVIDSIPEGKKIKRATLVLSRLNTRQSNIIGVYDIHQGQEWTEYGLTWDNQPTQGTLIKTYDSGVRPGTSEIDLTSYVSEWYEGGRSHNGFMLRALDELESLGKYKQYGTREGDHPPYLEIEYYDPTVYSHKKNDLPSSVFIYAVGEDDLPGSVVVNSYVDDDDLEGHVIVRDPTAPVDDDLPASVVIVKSELPSTVFVVSVGEDDIDGLVKVRHTYSNDMDAVVRVNRPEIEGCIFVRYYSDLDGTMVVRGAVDSEIYGHVVVNRPEIEGSVEVRYYDDLPGSVVPRLEVDEELPSSVVINATEREGTIYVRFYDDIDGSVVARALGYDEIPSTVFIRSEFIKSVVYIRRTNDEDIDSSFIIRAHDFHELDGTVIPRIPEDNDLPSTIKIRVGGEYDTPGTVIPRVVGAYDILTELEIEISYVLPSSVYVRIPEDDYDDEIFVFIM